MKWRMFYRDPHRSRDVYFGGSSIYISVLRIPFLFILTVLFMLINAVYTRLLREKLNIKTIRCNTLEVERAGVY